MEVDVIKLRDRGQKMPRDTVKTIQPMHGFIELTDWHLKNATEDRIVKELVLKSAPDATSRPMATLTSPVQTRLKGNEMVYVGTESVGGVEYPQAWWCRLARRPPNR